MYRTTIMLPEDLKARVVRESRAMGLTMGEYVREALTAALADKGESTAADPLLADTVVYEGDAPRDAAQQHDRYLYGDPE